MKTAKRLLTLALALCMLIGIPFAVSAADEPFEVVSVVEAPVGYDWDSVTWVNGMTADTFKAQWLGKAVIVTFNRDLSESALQNLADKTVVPQVQAIGGTAGNLKGDYRGHIDSNAIVFTHSYQGYTQPQGSSGSYNNNNSYRTFDYVRSTKSPNYFILWFISKTDTNDDGFMDMLTDVNGTPLTGKPSTLDYAPAGIKTWRMTDRNVLNVLNVAPLADSKISNDADKGHIWLVKFNQNIDPSIKTSTGKILLWVTDANGDRLNGTYETCRIVADYCSDDVLAIRPNQADYTVTYYENLATQKGTTVGGYGVEFNDSDGANKRNNCIDMFVSRTGEALPCTVSIDGFDWNTGSQQANDLWVSDLYEAYGAKIGDANYKTFAEAMTAAKSGETVTMLNDAVCAGPVFILNAGVNLDLNGFALTAENVMAFGHVTDSTDGEGKLVIGKDKYTDLLANNQAMPLYDQDGYRFFDYTFMYEQRESGDTNANKYYIHLGFDKAEAYELLAENDDLKISVNMTVTKADGKVQYVNYVFSDGTMNDYAQQSAANLAKTKAIILTVNGVAGMNITAQAAVVSPTRLSLAGDLVMAQ